MDRDSVLGRVSREVGQIAALELGPDRLGVPIAQFVRGRRRYALAAPEQGGPGRAQQGEQVYPQSKKYRAIRRFTSAITCSRPKSCLRKANSRRWPAASTLITMRSHSASVSA